MSKNKHVTKQLAQLLFTVAVGFLLVGIWSGDGRWILSAGAIAIPTVVLAIMSIPGMDYDERNNEKDADIY